MYSTVQSTVQSFFLYALVTGILIVILAYFIIKENSLP